MEGEGIQFTEQDESKAAYQDRPGPRDIVIDWARQDAEEIARLARATNPTYVGAVFSLGGGPAYVPQATPLEGILGDEPSGTVVRASLEHGLWVRCARGTTLRLDILSTDLGVMTGGRALAVLGVREGAVLQVQPT